MARIGINNELSKMFDKNKEVNEQFLLDLQTSIEVEASKPRKSSNYYKPSSLTCPRQAVFGRLKIKQEPALQSYNGVGMADTGTRRHEAIQDAIIKMAENLDKVKKFKYIDPIEYAKENKLPLVVQSRRGNEVHFFDMKHNISFMCDGILSYENQHYLFEFKNQISFKAKDKKRIDNEHRIQVISYCTSLGLNKVIMLYENRDNCELFAPPIFEVKTKTRNDFSRFIEKLEEYVNNNRIPRKSIIDEYLQEIGLGDNVVANMIKEIKPPCKYCKYSSYCNSIGDKEITLK